MLALLTLLAAPAFAQEATSESADTFYILLHPDLYEEAVLRRYFEPVVEPARCIARTAKGPSEQFFAIAQYFSVPVTFMTSIHGSSNPYWMAPELEVIEFQSGNSMVVWPSDRVGVVKACEDDSEVDLTVVVFRDGDASELAGELVAEFWGMMFGDDEEDASIE